MVAGRLGARAMWVPRVIPRFWLAFSGRARGPGLVPTCVPRATLCSTPCQSPVARLGLRLGRGHFSVIGLACFPPKEFHIRGLLITLDSPPPASPAAPPTQVELHARSLQTATEAAATAATGLGSEGMECPSLP